MPRYSPCRSIGRLSLFCVRIDFPDHYQLYAAACRFEISEDNGRRYLRLSDSDCGDHCFPCSRTRRFSWTQTFAIIFICIGVYLVEVAESKEK